MKVGDLLLNLGIESADFKTAITKAATEAGDAGGKTLGDKLKASLSKAMVGIGAATGAGLASSVQEFVKFDDQMRTVYTLLPDISEKAMGEMEDQVKGLAVEMGRLPEDIIPGLYDALSSGIPQENVFAFMESAAKAAVAGGANTQEVVKVLSATINAFGLDAANTEQLTDSFFNAINKGVTTFPELAGAMSQVTPTAAAMGLSIEDVLAAITAMTLQGTPTAQAVTGINASLVALQRTTPQMEQALKNLGYETGQAALDALGYQGTMEALAGEAKRLGVPLIELTGRMEGSAAMLQLTGENAEKANELLDSFGDTADQTTKAFETMEGGVGGAARRLAAQVRVVMIDIGEQFQALGPLFTAFGPTMGRLLGAGLGAVGGIIARVFVGLLRHAGILGAATAVGAATGGAQAAGHEAAATGPGVIRSLFARIAAMGVPLAPAGTTIGTAIGGMIGPGILVGIAAGVALAVEAHGPQIGRQIHDAIFGEGNTVIEAGKVWGMSYAEGIGKGLSGQEARDYAMKGVRFIYGDSVTVKEAEDAAYQLGLVSGAALGIGLPVGLQASGSGVVGALGHVMEELPPVAEAGGADVAEAWKVGLQSSGSWTDPQLPEDLRAQMLEAHRIAAWGGAQTPGEFSQGLRSAFDTVRSAFTDLKDLMKNTLNPIQQEAELIGIATHQRLTRALADGRPGVRGEAQQIALETIAQLHKLAPGSEAIGHLSMKLLAGATEDEKPAIRDAIAAILGAAETGLSGMSGIGQNAGAAAGMGVASGLDSPAIRRAVRDAMSNIANIVKRGFLLESPAKEGPWSEKGGPMAWMQRAGEGMGDELAGGLGRRVSAVALASRKLTAAALVGAVGSVGLPQLALAPMGLDVGSLRGSAVGGIGQLPSGPAIHLHVGTLIADEAGLAELSKRMEHAAGFGYRTRAPVTGF